ncbi:hypothetical protein GH5_03324 [Leishmania sp. Ghana 2012 LV757]|uniref:hypothetical protein n=1 Tax=Leishmania sp. Ghana 2012 LV757 TaxID=2803181 RepID=UPI001B52579B|nr:hypothetical protein GH5_03324 [Leishmania sp. Ghana 2012 LV757]
MLRACGITGFLTPLPHLTSPSALCADEAWGTVEAAGGVMTPVRCATGILKQIPEDFYVVEVDPAGQRTDAEDYSFLSASAPSLSGSAADDLIDGEAEEGTLSEPEADLGSLPPVLPGQPKSPEACLGSVQAVRGMLTARTPELHRCFGTVEDVSARASSTFTQAGLSLLLREIRAAAKGDAAMPGDGGSTAPCAADASLPWWRTAAHTLGHFPDKRERQLMHLMVRWHFPHLRPWAGAPPSPCAAGGTSSGGDSASLTSCSLDLHYVLFCATLGGEAALCLARWSVEVQAARQRRSLGDETRAELHEIFASHDPEARTGTRAATTAAEKGLCSTSFDSLAEAMRRQPADESATSVAAESVPLVSDKEVRRQVHALLRRFYPFASCQVREGHVTLRFCARSDGRRVGTCVGARRTRAEMEANEEGGLPLSVALVPDSATPAYVHVVVKKRNLDTAEMRQLLGEYFGVKGGSVCIAGMKDKRAVSVQRCSVPVAAASAAQSRVRALLNAAPFHPVTLRWPADPLQSYAVLLRASTCSEPVRLGQLSGNWFLLRVRDVRWASEADCKTWASPPHTADLESTPSSATCASAQQQLREVLQQRFARCVEVGFVNYFGQQRFSETIERVDDHTGVHLFAARWVAAVRSLYRACPEVYDAFPDKMEARFVPSKARDAQIMTHALRQTYRMHFSEWPLSSADVQGESEVWTRLCEKAITEGVPFHLRSLWVHAGQSIFFNLAASYVASGGIPRAEKVAAAPRQDGSGDCESEKPSATLSLETLADAQLPLGGYQVGRAALDSSRLGDSGSTVLWSQWRNAAVQYALRELRWTPAQGFEQRRVAGVPVPGSWRAVVARPTHATLEWETEVKTEAQQEACRDDGFDASANVVCGSTMQLSFALPSSCYATVLLREVLGCDKWW